MDAVVVTPIFVKSMTMRTARSSGLTWGEGLAMGQTACYCGLYQFVDQLFINSTIEHWFGQISVLGLTLCCSLLEPGTNVRDIGHICDESEIAMLVHVALHNPVVARIERNLYLVSKNIYYYVFP